MADILHRLSMSAPPEAVYAALLEGSLLTSFRSLHVSVQTVGFEDGARIVWRCTDGPPEWIGTDIMIDLAREGRETVVSFAHANWHSPSLFMAQCTTSWARALLAFKRWVETPEPDDLVAD